MNNHTTCDKEALVAYLYGDCGEGEQLRLSAHLAECTACSAELEALQKVRGRLGAWTPPAMMSGVQGAPRVRMEPGLGLATVAGPPSTITGMAGTRASRMIGPLPAWAMAAAALLVVAAGAAVANLEVRYGPQGLLVRTGWSSAADPVSGAATRDPAVSLADLTALENRLRAELPRAVASGQSGGIAPAGASSDAEMLRRVRTLIEASEQRQQQQLALRLTQLVHDFDRQRQVDLLRIQQGFGELQGMTGAEVARQREALNYLMRVSERR